MRAADHIVDFGPGPGVRGGEIVAKGTVDDDRQRTAERDRGVPVGPTRDRGPDSSDGQSATERIKITGATHNNLQNVDVEIPLGRSSA